MFYKNLKLGMFPQFFGVYESDDYYTP